MKKIFLILILFQFASSNSKIICQINLSTDLFNSDGTYYSPLLAYDYNGKLNIESFSWSYCLDKKGKYQLNCLNTLQFNISNSGLYDITSCSYNLILKDGSGKVMLNKDFTTNDVINSKNNILVKIFLDKGLKSQFDFNSSKPTLSYSFLKIEIDQNSFISKINSDLIKSQFCYYDFIKKRWSELKAKLNISDDNVIDNISLKEFENKRNNEKEKNLNQFVSYWPQQSQPTDKYAKKEIWCSYQNQTNEQLLLDDYVKKDNNIITNLIGWALIQSITEKLRSIKITDVHDSCAIIDKDNYKYSMYFPYYFKSRSSSKVFKRVFYLNEASLFKICDEIPTADELAQRDINSIQYEDDFIAYLVQADPKKYPKSKQTFAIKLWKGCYMRAGDYRSVDTNSKYNSQINNFDFYQLQDNSYIIKNSFGGYLTVDFGTIKFSEEIRDARIFFLDKQNGNKFAFSTGLNQNKLYFSAPLNFKDQFAFSKKIQNTELFELIPYSDVISLNNVSQSNSNLASNNNKKQSNSSNNYQSPVSALIVAFKAFDGKFFGIGQNGMLVFRDGNAGDANKIELIAQTDGKFVLKASNGKYISSSNGDLFANKDQIGDQEKFTLEKQADGKYALKTSKNKYVRAAKTFLTNSLSPDRDKAGDQEKYELLEFKK